jgi:hypothetical protein
MNYVKPHKKLYKEHRDIQIVTEMIFVRPEKPCGCMFIHDEAPYHYSSCVALNDEQRSMINRYYNYFNKDQLYSYEAQLLLMEMKKTMNF